MAPWTIRNYARLGAFAPVSAEGGVNFFLADNPNTTGLFQEIDDAAPEEYDRITKLPEVEQAREWIRLGFRHIEEHPVRSVRNWLRNAAVFVGSRNPWVHEQSRLRG